MKSFIVFAVLIAASLAASINPDGEAVILRYDNDNAGFNGYNYAYETSNGIQAQEEAQEVNSGLEDQHLVVKGAFKYVGTDGVEYLVTYTADKDGFHPEGLHLPKA